MTNPETVRVPAPMWTLPNEPQSTWAFFSGQGDDPAVDSAAGLGPQAPHETADLLDSAFKIPRITHSDEGEGRVRRALRQAERDRRTPFRELGGLQAHLAWWQREIADRRCHGTTGEVPLVRFEREAGRLREALAFLVEREVSRKDERRIEMAFKIDGSLGRGH